MRKSIALSAISALALATSACGSPAEEAVAPAESADAAPAAEGEAVPAGEETPAPDASEGATPTPTPSASASSAAPAPATPTPVAAATPPAAFTTCTVCHSVERGQNGIGPSLAGVFGRRSGSAPGFSYSAGMQGANVTWNDAALQRYLTDPASVAPGTTMPSPGLTADQRRAVIAYLRTL